MNCACLQISLYDLLLSGLKRWPHTFPLLLLALVRIFVLKVNLAEIDTHSVFPKMFFEHEMHWLANKFA